MGKFFVRITIVLVTIYFLVSYILAQFFGVDILRNTYILLFETCVVIYTFSEGKYHCRYIKWVALSILLCDTLVHIDYYFNIFTTPLHNLLPASILALGIGTSITLALRHFYKVNQLRNKRNKQWK